MSCLKLSAHLSRNDLTRMMSTIIQFHVDLFNNSVLLICTKLLNYKLGFHWKLFFFQPLVCEEKVCILCG